MTDNEQERTLGPQFDKKLWVKYIIVLLPACMAHDALHLHGLLVVQGLHLGQSQISYNISVSTKLNTSWSVLCVILTVSASHRIPMSRADSFGSQHRCEIPTSRFY